MLQRVVLTYQFDTTAAIHPLLPLSIHYAPIHTLLQQGPCWQVFFTRSHTGINKTFRDYADALIDGLRYVAAASDPVAAQQLFPELSNRCAPLPAAACCLPRLASSVQV